MRDEGERKMTIGRRYGASAFSVETYSLTHRGVGEFGGEFFMVFYDIRQYLRSGKHPDNRITRYPRQIDLGSAEWREDEWKDWEDAEPRADIHVFTDLFGLLCLMAVFALVMFLIAPILESLEALLGRVL